MSNLAKDMQTHLPQDESLQLAGIYSQRYLLESCRSLEELEIQVTSLFTQFKLRERDGYLSRLNPHVPLATRRELRVSRGKQGKGHYFSGQSAHRGKGRGAKGSGRL